MKTQTKQPALFGDQPEPKPAAKPAVQAKAKTASKAVALREVEQPIPQNILAIIARAAADPKVQPEKMRAILDMQKEIMADEARMAFTEGFIALQGDLPVINAKGRIVIEGKSGKRGQNTPYATFNEINRVTKPILQKHGFALWFSPDIGTEGKIVIRGHLDHVRGHGKECIIALPLDAGGSKSNVQGVGSSLSYGKRYAAIALLNLVSEAQEDIDTDGAAVVDQPEKKPITAKQVADLKKAIEDCGVGVQIFCDKYEIEKVENLQPQHYQSAMTACENFKRNRKSQEQR